MSRDEKEEKRDFKEERRQDDRGSSYTVFVGGLPKNYKEGDITGIFSKIGDISKVDFKPDYAFVVSIKN